MAFKFLHMADFHLDSPFEGLPEEKAILRRREQRELFASIPILCEKHGVSVVLLSGDIFDSIMPYKDTVDLFIRTLRETKAHVFIAPGNHDWFCARSPYNRPDLPENVKVFTRTVMSSFELPELGLRVFGAGFTSPGECAPLLTGFKAPADMTNILVMHGDAPTGSYNPVSPADVRDSNLDYIALGHVHTFDGVKETNGVIWSWPGCPAGRGFDETGEKGYIVGTIDGHDCSVSFYKTDARQYRIVNVDVSESHSAEEAIASAVSGIGSGDVCRVILTGESQSGIDASAVISAFRDRFFHFELSDRTFTGRDLWALAGDDTLEGIFIRKMKERFDASDEEGRELILTALKRGVGALENREEWC